MELVNSKKQHSAMNRSKGSMSESVDDINMKGLWRRAFHTLKIKDKDKSSKKSIAKKRDSKTSLTQQSAEDYNDGHEMDPVYSLLKSAAGKSPKNGSRSSSSMGGSFPNRQPISIADLVVLASGNNNVVKLSGTNSPVSVHSRESSPNTNTYAQTYASHNDTDGHASNAQLNRIASVGFATSAGASTCASVMSEDSSGLVSGSSQASWTRRKAMMNAFRMKSFSIEENFRDNFERHQNNDNIVKNDADTKSPLSRKNKIDSRNKSFSMDNADPVAPHNQEMLKIVEDSRKKSSSFTNTNCIESAVPASPHRKKQLYARKKSFSTESHVPRRVEFDEESILRKESDSDLLNKKNRCKENVSDRTLESTRPRESRRSREVRSSITIESASPRSNSTRSSPLVSPRNSPNRGDDLSSSPSQRSSAAGLLQTTVDKRRRQWQMKSFSLDTSETPRHTLDVDSAGAVITKSKKSPSPLGACFADFALNEAYGVASKSPSPPADLDIDPRTSQQHQAYQYGSQTQLQQQQAHRSLPQPYSRAPLYVQATLNNSSRQRRLESTGHVDTFDNAFDHEDQAPVTSTSAFNRNHERRLSGNLYVVLYDFHARHRDELELRAGNKISVMDMKDADWWKGKCLGRVGYFPATYVQRVRHGDQVYRVIHSIQLLDESGSALRLFRRQIVVKIGSEENGVIKISMKDGKEVFCPIDYLEKVCD